LKSPHPELFVEMTLT